MNILNLKNTGMFGYSDNIHFPFTENKTLADILEEIKTNVNEKKIKILRETNPEKKVDQATAKKIKESLPVYYPCTFDGGNKTAEHINTISNHIVIDIDYKDNKKRFENGVEALKEELKEIEFINYIFVSPSGNGLKIGIDYIDISSCKNLFQTVDNVFIFQLLHKFVFEKLKIFFNEKLLKIDQLCSNINRACFLSIDENIFINENNLIYDYDVNEFLSSLQTAQEKSDSYNYQQSTIIDSNNNINEEIHSKINMLLSIYRSKKIVLFESYKDWYNLANCLLFHYENTPDIAKNLYHGFSELSTKYNKSQVDKQFNQCKKVFKSNKCKTDIKWLCRYLVKYKIIAESHIEKDFKFNQAFPTFIINAENIKIYKDKYNSENLYINYDYYTELGLKNNNFCKETSFSINYVDELQVEELKFDYITFGKSVSISIKEFEDLKDCFSSEPIKKIIVSQKLILVDSDDIDELAEAVLKKYKLPHKSTDCKTFSTTLKRKPENVDILIGKFDNIITSDRTEFDKFTAAINYVDISKRTGSQTILNWMVGVFINLFDDGAVYEHALAIKGIPGCGKTLTFRDLLCQKMFGEYVTNNSSYNIDDKELQRKMSRNIILFDDEAVGLTKHKATDFKNVLSLRKVNTRKLYKENQNIEKRICSFIMALNQDDVISDSSGTRKLHILEIDSINYEEYYGDYMNDYDKIDIEKVWGYAYYLYVNKVKRFKDELELDLQELHNGSNKFNSATNAKTELQEYLIEKESNPALTAEQIRILIMNSNNISEYTKNELKIGNKNNMQMGRLLSELGYKSIRTIIDIEGENKKSRTYKIKVL